MKPAKTSGMAACVTPPPRLPQPAVVAFAVPTQFGANIVILQPGALSSLRHWHLNEDEFVMMIEGTCVMVQDAGEVLMQTGDFDTAARYGDKAASTPGAHYLIAMIALAANSLAGRHNQAARWKQEVVRRNAGAAAAHYFAAFPTRDVVSKTRIAAVLDQHGF